MKPPLIETRYPHIVVRTDGKLILLPSYMKVMVVIDALRGYEFKIDELLKDFTQLSLVEVHSAMTYYLDHKSAIDTELDTKIAEIDKYFDDRKEQQAALKKKLLERAGRQP